jgi:hypothetical protein
VNLELNLPAERASHGLSKLAAIEAVRGSFDDAKAAIERVTGTRIGKRQVEALTERAAADIEAFYRATAPAACTDETLLVCSVDGKGIGVGPHDVGRVGDAVRGARYRRDGCGAT